MSELGFSSYKKPHQAWLYFMYFWVVFGVGTFFGQFIPPAFLGLITIGLFLFILITLFSKKSYDSLKWNTIFAFLLGLISYTSFNYYLKDLGEALFYQVILLAIVAFLITGALGYFVLKDTSNWAKGLMTTLLALVVVSFIGIFLHMTWLHLIISVVGLGLFLLFNIYDFNRMKRDDYSPMEMGFNLFLNLLNIILDLLRLFSIIKD